MGESKVVLFFFAPCGRYEELPAPSRRPKAWKGCFTPPAVVLLLCVAGREGGGWGTSALNSALIRSPWPRRFGYGIRQAHGPYVVRSPASSASRKQTSRAGVVALLILRRPAGPVQWYGSSGMEKNATADGCPPDYRWRMYCTWYLHGSPRPQVPLVPLVPRRSLALSNTRAPSTFLFILAAIHRPCDPTT